jgi:hypothetical protein
VSREKGKPLRLSLVVLIIVGVLLILPAFVTPTFGANQAPTASFTYSPSFPAPDEIITFDASASYDLDGQIVQYRWDFGDGAIATLTSPITTHSYPADGNYTVELTVTDNSGATGVTVAVVQVQCVVFFRVVTLGTLNPVSNVEVTMYYYDGSAWVKAPAGSYGVEIKYDNMTQPDLANSNAERYRNPGFSASILRKNASNIGFDIHPSQWKVFFKFQWGPYVAYWPNDTKRVYTYYKGSVVSHDYAYGHRAWWDPTVGTYVIRAGDIAGAGVSPTDSNPIILGIQYCPPPAQYYLTVRTDPLGITTIPGEGWYNSGTDSTLTAPTYVNVSAITRYRFNYWDVDGTSQGVGVNPVVVHMTANHTATAHYILQYSAVFNHTGLVSDATGTVVTVNGSSKTYGDLPYTLWADSGSAVTYSYSTPVSSSTTGKRFRLNSVSGSTSPISVTGPVSVVGNYVIQYLMTFTQSGLDSTATGTVVTVNGSAKTYANLPYQWWVDSGSAVTYSYSSIVSSSTTGKRFSLTSVECPPPPFVVTGPVTLTGYYCTQYSVSFGQSGLDSSATGVVVTVNGTSKTYAELPYSLWVNSGSSIMYSFTSPVPSSSPSKQFRLSSITGPTSPITVSGPTTVTGNYVAQYLLTFTQSGLDTLATGTVVTVNGSAKVFGNLPYGLWVDVGSSVSYSYTSPVSSSIVGKQFRLTTVSGPSSPITVSGATTVTGNYVIQYLVTFAQTGLDSTATGTVVTVNSSSKTYGDLPYSLWVDAGFTVTYSYSTPVSSTTTGKQFRFDSVSGPTSPITVSNSAIVTGDYVTQYFVTFAQTGLDGTATGTVVTVNSNVKEATDLPFSLWADSGSSVTYSYNDVVLSTVAGKRFNRTGVSGPSSPISVTNAVTVSGNYNIQYCITFDQTGVGSDFTGTILTIDTANYVGTGLPVSFWWNKDSSHNFSFTSQLVVNASLQYAWSSTSGLSGLRNGTIVITASGNVVGNYVIQNTVTFDVTGVGSDFTGAVLTVDGLPYALGNLPKSFAWQLGSVHNFSFQSPLVVTTNVKRYVWTNTTGLSTLQSGSITITGFGSIIGNYKTQYYLSLAVNPPGIGSPSNSGWYDSGSLVFISTPQYVPGGSRWRFVGWTTDDMSEITDPLSPNTTVLIDKGKTVTAQHVHQYLLTFDQTGLASDADGNIVTVNGTSSNFSQLPYAIWVDEGDTITYSYEATVPSTVAGKRFKLDSVTGPVSPILVAADTNVTGNYLTQYYLTVSSPYSTPNGEDWYDSGSTAAAGLSADTVDQGNGTRRVFTNWNGDATGTNYAASDPILMNAPKTAVARWKTQYNVTFAQLGLDSSAVGTVVTVNGTSMTYGQLPDSSWVDSDDVVTYSYYNVSSSCSGKRFILTGVSSPSSPMLVTGPVLVTGNYKTQYQIVFSQTGVESDFTGTIVTVDGTGYTLGTLPTFWWDDNSSHTFGFASPLVVNASKQYVWVSTTGLSTLQNGTVVAGSGSGSVTGNYVAQSKYQIIFDQTGVSSDFLSTVVIVDGVNYKLSDLQVTFFWGAGEVHDFAYQSPLVVGANIKQYVWTSTTGLSTSQSGSITVTGPGSVIGNYKTQYYLTLATNPSGVTSPSGAGWYDANAQATVSTDAFVNIVVGSSRYRFNGWSTADMAEISNPMVSPTQVFVDKGKTVTANYVIQYNVTFAQTGVGSDFSGAILNVDGANYSFTGLSVSFWWDVGTDHSFSYQSPLVVTPNVKRYVWISTSGLVTSQNGTITVTGAGIVTGNYKTQYYLTVTSAYSTPTGQGWYDSGASAYAGLTEGTVDYVNGTRRVFTHWSGDASGTNYAQSSAIVMNNAKTATANWKTQYYLTVRVNPSGITSILGEGWYDAAASVSLTAPNVSGYDFTCWFVDGVSQGDGVTTIAVLMNAPHGATASYTQLAQSTVGGYSISLTESVSASFIAIYFALLAMLGVSVSWLKRKRK